MQRNFLKNFLKSLNIALSLLSRNICLKVSPAESKNPALLHVTPTQPSPIAATMEIPLPSQKSTFPASPSTNRTASSGIFSISI